MTVPAIAGLLVSWMTSALLIGAAVSGVAWLVHRLVRELVPARFVWSSALLATVGLSIALPWRQRATTTLAITPVPAAPVAGSVTPAEALPFPDRVATALDRTGAMFGNATARVATAAAHGVQRAPRPVQIVVLAAWPIASLALFAVTMLGYRRQLRRLRFGEPALLEGTPVILSESVGPAVVGVFAPRIVMPRWILTRSAEEQGLVVAHERSHIAARDPLLLIVACAAVVCLPWHAALWWMLSRLRLAIELDCDRRVLAGGTTRRRYGELLVELSAVPSGISPLAPIPAFSFRTSHLERRLLTMTAHPASHRTLRRTSALFVGVAGLLAACGAELPTATELQGLDVAKAETRIGKAVRLDSGTTVYVVNGQKVAAGAARAIAADSIVTINVKKTGARANEIRIVTKGMPLNTAEQPGRVLKITGTGDSAIVVTGRPPSGADPLYVIDGQRASKADMEKLSPTRIESVSITKGPAAVARFGPEAAAGVVEIVLKK